MVEKRFIELGPEIGNNVVVERGLGPDEMIIVEGFHKLSHGAKVAPIIVEPETIPAEPDSEGRYSLGTDSTSAAGTRRHYRTGRTGRQCGDIDRHHK